MPAGISPDGVHPNDAAHTEMLQNAIDQYYSTWLDPVGLPLNGFTQGALMVAALGSLGIYLLRCRSIERGK